MGDPVELHRKEVEQRIRIAESQGGWEGTHTDFKRELGSRNKDFGKLLKHVLAFANTPRRTDAYIIFGVNEDKEAGVFEHIGVVEGGFPTSERIDELIRQHTTLRNVFVDSHFALEGKRTPYISIPIQYEGPHTITAPFHGTISPNEVFCRYGSSSIRATDRDLLRMKNDWDTWFLDSRYEKTTNSMMALLSRRFPNYNVLDDSTSHVRLIYESDVTDEFGTHRAPVLLHAYCGFDPVGPSAVTRILEEKTTVFQRIIIGSRFSPDTLGVAAQSAVRCIPLDDIYFVNDPYALLCRDYLREWEQERTRTHLNFIVDLDFHPSGSTGTPNVQRSILTFLEKKLGEPGRFAVLVHGDFGCGKTTTAKQLVADLYSEYLRGDVSAPKVMYVDVNNIDIRSRRDECIKSQLSRSHLTREAIESLVTMVRNDQMHLVFDGVDEMARPYNASGRRESIELLRDVGNRISAIYMARSSYYPQLDEMIRFFNPLSDHDFVTGRKKTVSIEILGLRQEQVMSFLDSRLGSEESHELRSILHKMHLESFLSDPLIISSLTMLVEGNGIESIRSLPSTGQKAHLLGFLVDLMLLREQTKRARHGGLAENFDLFQRVLQGVAFSMVCRGSVKILPSQLEAYVRRTLEPSFPCDEAVDAFRTMSWIHRSDDGSLSFRHDSLTHVCAAGHMRATFELRDCSTLSDWQPAAPLADVVIEYAGKTLSSKEIMGATALLGSELQFNVRQLIVGTLQCALQRTDFKKVPEVDLDEHFIAAICKGILSEPTLAQLPLHILFDSLSEKRKMQLALPLIWHFGKRDLPGSVPVVLFLIDSKIMPKWNYCDELEQAKKDPTSSIDSMLLKNLGVNLGELLDYTSYETLFRRILNDPKVERRAVQFADRTLKSIEGEQHRRQSDFLKNAKQTKYDPAEME